LKPLSAAEAARHILGSVTPQPHLRVFLDGALNSVLAEDIVSPLDIPAHTNSAMDGYAARSTDIRGASGDRPIKLKVIENLPAGTFATKSLGKNECARIFTGAALPPEADTVVRQEDTDEGDPVVEIRDDRDANRNIRHAGEDIREGTTVLTAGMTLTAAHLGVLASIAHAHPLVFRAPRVGIMGGGDEIVDVDQPEEILSGRKTASSNTHTLRALVFEAGGEPVDLGIAADSPESLHEHFERATDCDLVVTSAGISVGEHDYIRQVLEERGGVIDFWRLRMRPGAPVGYGFLGPTPWIGLPGNPVSTMVTFELFVRPAIRKMMGHSLPFRSSVTVRLSEPVKTSSGLQHFLRGIVTPTSDGLEARLTGPQGSGILMSMIHANALLILPEGRNETPAGTDVTALMFDDPRNQKEPPFS
jgi:molybdopterin molybdotransferase